MNKIDIKVIPKILVIILVILTVIYTYIHFSKNDIITKNIQDIAENIEYNYKNPVVPEGFQKVDTETAKWNNLTTDYNKGLVIQDEFENQFVWVPVKNIANFKKDYSFKSIYSADSTNTSDLYLPENVKEIETIKKYGGFYIGRYESMFDYNSGNIRVAVKKSLKATDTIDWSNKKNQEYTSYLWNYITFYDAKKYSELMAKSYDYNTEKVLTNLVTGTQWDTTINWIKATNNIKDDSVWGNYIDSSEKAKIDGSGKIQISGYSKSWCKNNIYDMAGNLWEWTNETYTTSDSGISRGASYIFSGKEYGAGYRTYNESDSTYARIGFRVALYIK